MESIDSAMSYGRFLLMLAWSAGTSICPATNDRGYDVIVTGVDREPEAFTDYLEIDVRGLDRFMAEPQCDDGCLHPSVQQIHCRRMVQAMERDALFLERCAGLTGNARCFCSRRATVSSLNGPSRMLGKTMPPWATPVSSNHAWSAAVIGLHSGMVRCLHPLPMTSMPAPMPNTAFWRSRHQHQTLAIVNQVLAAGNAPELERVGIGRRIGIGIRLHSGVVIGEPGRMRVARIQGRFSKSN